MLAVEMAAGLARFQWRCSIRACCYRLLRNPTPAAQAARAAPPQNTEPRLTCAALASETHEKVAREQQAAPIERHVHDRHRLVAVAGPEHEVHVLPRQLELRPNCPGPRGRHVV